MEMIGHLTREVLANCKRAMEARKNMTPGGHKGREGFKEPEAAPDWQQAPGNSPVGGGTGRDHTTREEGRGGLEIGRGQELRVYTTAPVEGPVVTTTCPHTKRLVGGAISGQVSNCPALRIDLRGAARVRLGGFPRPSSRLMVPCNDNRHAATAITGP